MLAEKFDARIPTHRHWKMLRDHDLKQLNPQEFLQKWSVSRKDLADLCDCSLSTVNHWFSKGGAEKIELKYLRRLAEVDCIWSSLENCPPHLKEIYSRRDKK